MIEKTEGTITNGQSRDTGNIGHTQHRMKTNKTQHSKLKRTHQKPEGTQELADW